MYIARGAFFCETKKYNEALSDLEMALSMKKDSEEDLLHSRILTQMGHLHLKQQHCEEASKYLKDAEKIETALCIKQCPANCERLSVLAKLYYLQKKYDDALEICENILQILSQRPLFNQKSIGQIHIHLGCIYEQKCLYDKSLNAFGKALHSFEKVLENTHSTIAYIHYKIAIVLKNRGNHVVILDAFKKALYYELQSTSTNYFNRADIYDNLGCLMQQQRDIAIATEHFQQSLEIRLKHNPEDVFMSYVNMGRLKAYEDKHLDAEEPYQKAIEFFSPYSDLAAGFSLGHIYVDLAYVYNHSGQYDKAMETLSIATQVNLSDDQKLNSLIALETGFTLQMQNRYDKALKYYEKVLSETHLLDDDRIQAETCMKTSDIYCNRQQHMLTIEYCEKGLNYKFQTILLNRIYQYLAQCYVSLGQEEESMKFEYYGKAINSFIKRLGLPLLSRDSIREINDSIAKLCFEINDIDSAIKHYEILRDDLLKLSPKKYDELLNVCNALVICYERHEDKSKLIENYQYALDVFLNDDYPLVTEDLNNVTLICNCISVLYYEIENFEKAIEYANIELEYQLKIMESLPEFDDEIMSSLAQIYLNLSTLYEESDDTGNQIVLLETLLNAYETFVSISKSASTYLTMTVVRENLSECYERVNNLSMALNYYQEAFEFRKKFGTMDEENFNKYQERLTKLQKVNGMKE